MTPRTAHRSQGVYRILDRPRVYDRFMKLLGARHSRQRFVREFVQPFEAARVLDIGCGPGTLLEHLPSSVDYTGLDMNPSYVEAARQRYGKRGRFFCARVGGGDTDAMAGGAFDFAIARGLLHHLDDGDAGHLIASARRSLKPGGVFVSVDPVFGDGLSIAARTLLSLDRGRYVRAKDGYRRLVAVHFSELEMLTVDDFTRVPYRHLVVRAR